FYGTVIGCADDEVVRRVLPRVSRRVVTYGRAHDASLHIAELHSGAAAGGCLSRFRVRYGARDLGEFQIHVPGAHNVLNATAAIAVGIGLDVAENDIRRALDEFSGVDRRFQRKGTAAGVIVIDDY